MSKRCSGFSVQFSHEFTGIDRKRQELFLLGKGLLERNPVINDNIEIAEIGCGKVPAVSARINGYQVGLPTNFDGFLMHEKLFHDAGPKLGYANLKAISGPTGMQDYWGITEMVWENIGYMTKVRND